MKHNIEDIALAYKARCQPKESTKTCLSCKENIPISQGMFTIHMKFYCPNCSLLITNLHTPSYMIQNNEIIQQIDYQNTREYLIQFLYALFDQTLKPQLFKQIQNYEKKYSYLDIIRAVEFHHVIKRNKIQEQHKGTIGIVPYVIEQAREYYHKLSAANHREALKRLNELKKINPSLISRIQGQVDSL